MKINRIVLAAIAGLCGNSASVMAQESSVYITQVNQAAPLTNSRRPTSPDTYSRVLGNASVPATVSPTAAPATLGVDLTALTANTSAVRNGASAASLSGIGAGNLTNNVAILNQVGFSNQGTIDQGGLNNFATATVNGDRNVTNQAQSNGGNNRSIIDVVGSDNNVTSGQNGSNDRSEIAFSGSGYTVNSQQIGSGLSYRIDTIGLPSSGKTITVTQTGGPMNAGTALNTLPASSFVPIPTGR